MTTSFFIVPTHTSNLSIRLQTTKSSNEPMFELLATPFIYQSPTIPLLFIAPRYAPESFVAGSISKTAACLDHWLPPNPFFAIAPNWEAVSSNYRPTPDIRIVPVLLERPCPCKF